MAKGTTERGLKELQCARAWTEDEGVRVVEALGRSGKTVAAFARGEGLVTHRVYWWRRRLGGTPLKASGLAVRNLAESPPSFLPLIVRGSPAAPSTTSAASVWTRDGHRIEVAELGPASAVWVATVMKSLEELPS